MPSNSPQIVQRLWNFCDVLRDDGVSYGDYVEQLTYLLFLKMDQERRELAKESAIPDEYRWERLLKDEDGNKLKGEPLESQYRQTLQELQKEGGMIGIIFGKAQNRIQNPARLRRLIDYIDEETWMGLDVDVKGDIYEGLLEKNAQDTKSGAGQYFTPRPLIKAMVDAVDPEPDQSIADPAVGTGGFFLASKNHITENNNLTRDQKQKLREDTFQGWEIVDNTARLCTMNLYLHGIGPREISDEEDPPVVVEDSLVSQPEDRYDLVLTNPPFGKKASFTVINEEGESQKQTLTYERDDFWTSTSNKQLNFLQHVANMLTIGGTAAIVVPDNVLFEGGAGETVRERLLNQYDVHTLLRLPTGIFYAQGVKANVLFFDRKPASETPWTETLWIYDLRTNKHFTLKRDPMTYEDLTDFLNCYNPENRHDREEAERFKAYEYDELIERDKTNLDISWLKDESLEDTENLPEPDVLASDIVENLGAALEQFRGIQEELEEPAEV
ncbi:type I restriction-modification system subunit M [Salinibacter ruber]|uniref:type I restriction-modification system subunit M n=1 Tax=Salinibacter ruber TaxID=146919 RepID=UPI0021697941|nr:class I SAM-dependent DNA methyltransferase [Salinibacter ruber]MCS3650379.1 type I restriction enzyme M protein [Salinibacter ruber]MCS3653631.1 type I restriction enzyme M protein [Salinibacter ruber]MCS4039728.1 type I restriction enzyme M protein [Salinibacter ruber]MCS4085833.1 type I restriction enzyme M protein [Salinibacter ruber]